MDSTLAVQQYIQQTIRRNPSNYDFTLNMPEGQDEGVWKYEHLRYVKLYSESDASYPMFSKVYEPVGL